MSNALIAAFCGLVISTIFAICFDVSKLVFLLICYAVFLHFNIALAIYDLTEMLKERK